MELAEREGFEPSVRVNVHTLSRRALSTTQTPLRAPKLRRIAHREGGRRLTQQSLTNKRANGVLVVSVNSNGPFSHPWDKIPIIPGKLDDSASFKRTKMNDHNPDSISIDVDNSYLASARNGFSLGHPFVWLGITIGFLIVGYIWLSIFAGGANASVATATVKKLNPEEAQNIVADEVVKKEPEMSITRQDDQDRAAEYLAYESIEQQILPLLDAADVQFENQQFVTPAGNNAWESYNAILQIEPEESIAVAGKTKIKSRLISNAETAIDSGNYEEAENWLGQLDLIQPDDSLQISLRGEISELIELDAEQKLLEQAEEEKLEKIQTALNQADTELSTNEPNFNKIRDLYGLVAELEPDNIEAQQGLAALSDRKLDEVEDALRNGDFTTASSELKKAKDIYPSSKRIGSLQLALDASLKQERAKEEEIIQKEKEAKAKAEAAATAKAQATKPKEPKQQKKPQKIEPSNSKTQIASTETLPTITDALAPSNNVTPKEPNIVSGVIGLNRTAKANIGANSAVLISGIKAYYDGEYAKSFELLYPLAQEGVTRAQFRIGIMYQFGRSVAKNPDLAEKWFTDALPELLRQSQKGVAWAQTDLGTAYEFGISLQQDFERAAFWYQKAANQGYAGAQTNLGVLYAQGDGVPYNRSKAVEWLKRAGAQGDRVANENLSILGVK